MNTVATTRSNLLTSLLATLALLVASSSSLVGCSEDLDDPAAVNFRSGGGGGSGDTDTDTDAGGTTSESTATTGADDVCEDFGETYAACTPGSTVEEGVSICEAETAAWLELGPGCLSEIESLYACAATLDCASFDTLTGCGPEFLDLLDCVGL